MKPILLEPFGQVSTGAILAFLSAIALYFLLPFIGLIICLRSGRFLTQGQRITVWVLSAPSVVMGLYLLYILVKGVVTQSSNDFINGPTQFLYAFSPLIFAGINIWFTYKKAPPAANDENYEQ